MFQCRICFEEDYRFNLLKPCACSGTLEYVHRNCLIRWLQHKNTLNPYSGSECEICKQTIRGNYATQNHNAQSSLRLYYILSIFVLYLLYFVLFTGRLHIVIHSGVLADADLWPFQKSDGYVEVCLDGHCGCKTEVVTNSHEPRWDTVCSEWSSKSVFIFSKLTLKVYDADYDFYDDFLGETDISIPWIVLSGGNGSPLNYTWTHPVHGSILVSVQWKMSILPYILN